MQRPETAPSALSEPGPSARTTPSLYRSPTSKLPRIHYLAYRGDLQGVLKCLSENVGLHETVSLRNQHGRLVAGITPLFLAAQRGHYEVAKLLVDNGANPVQPCFIEGSTELCTPAEVASLNLHFRLSRYLKKAVKLRRKEEQVLALDDQDRASQGSRMYTGMVRASSFRNSVGGGAGGGGAGPGSISRMSRGLSAMSVPVGGGSVMEGGAEANAAAMQFVQNMDLAAFDPEEDAQPRPVRNAPAIGSFFGRLFNRNRDSHQVSASQKLATNNAAPGDAASRAMRSMDLNNFDPERPDHTKVLDRFLRDLDLAAWDPQVESTPGRSQSPARSVGRGTSPARLVQQRV